ncbi:HEAT repeat domain-containing protein [Ottowia flava]|uniref:HEAT repeat domain-containing protein n=1 Tax=Ottowia flava TaxID=2675430 RepID=A0ABW4KXA7_9BURK|nr:HEAT repeat domain-containing protein [Ottowia sp. GY511]
MVFTIAIVTTLASLVLLLLCGLVQIRKRRQMLRVAEIHAQWRPIFLHAIEGERSELPRGKAQRSVVVVQLWLQLAELIRGTAQARLAAFAHDLGFEHAALRWLSSRALRRRMLGVAVLGLMRSHAGIAPLARMVRDPDPVLSVLAMRSLLLIDAAAHLRHCLPDIAMREDWPLIRVAAVLAELPSEVVHPLFRKALQDHRSKGSVRLLQLLQTARIEGDKPTLERFLLLIQPAEVLVAALKATRSPQLVRAVRGLIGHPNAEVRTHVAIALARIGTRDDALRLALMLSDESWAVRYQAAVALTRLPNLARSHLRLLLSALVNTQATAIINQALAERDALRRFRTT